MISAATRGTRHVTDAQCGGEFARTPMCGTIGRLAVQGPIDDACFQALSARSHRFARLASPETGDALLQKAVPPEFYGINAASLVSTYCRQSLGASQTQDDTGSSNIIGPTASTATNPSQLTSF